MPVITEEMLRSMEKKGQLEEVRITGDDILTPSAKEFLNSRKISLVHENEAQVKRTGKMPSGSVGDGITGSLEARGGRQIQEEAGKSPESLDAGGLSREKPTRTYTDHITGGIYVGKPEHMTQIFGNELVVKNHKRIVLRGKFDTLQAETVKYWKKYENNSRLEADFSQAYRFVRDLFISEMTDTEFHERDVLGYDIDTLKDITHNTMKYYRTGHLFEIDVTYDEEVIDINCLRAIARECEVAAVDAFYKEGRAEREDILRALNRLSSILYLMMLKANNGDYRHAASKT